MQDETKADGEGTRTRVGEIGSVAATGESAADLGIWMRESRQDTDRRQVKCAIRGLAIELNYDVFEGACQCVDLFIST